MVSQGHIELKTKSAKIDKYCSIFTYSTSSDIGLFAQNIEQFGWYIFSSTIWYLQQS